MKSLSNIFVEYFTPYEDNSAVDPITAAATKLIPKTGIPEMVNIATGFVCWWRCRERTIWRIRPETADYLSRVGIYFLPEKPPASWTGNAIVLESENKSRPLYDRYFSVMAYRAVAPSTGKPRYYFVSLDIDGGFYNFSIQADLGKIDAGKDILEMPFLLTAGYKGPADAKERALKTVRFVLAASYYLENKNRIAVQDQGGRVKRNAKGKAIKKSGKPVFVWRYADMSVIRESRTENAEPRGPLDTSGLNLEPVIVSPHIRLYKGKVIIVDAHSSHRWKRESAGVKRKI